MAGCAVASWRLKRPQLVLPVVWVHTGEARKSAETSGECIFTELRRQWAPAFHVPSRNPERSSAVARAARGIRCDCALLVPSTKDFQ